MNNSKVVSSIKEAVKLAGVKDGMTISFHHHLRNGDYVLNMVLEAIAELGIKDLNVNASSVFDTHEPLIGHIKNHVVTGLEADYIGGVVGRAISHGVLEKPVVFRTHGGRPADIELGRSPIDVAFVAAPTSDTMGNCSGKYGKSACGSLGYAFADAMFAKKVVVITDNLVPYPSSPASISAGSCSFSRIPLVVSVTFLIPGSCFSFLTSTGKFLRTRGSPPVSLILDMPRPEKISVSSSISS